MSRRVVRIVLVVLLVGLALVRLLPRRPAHGPAYDRGTLASDQLHRGSLTLQRCEIGRIGIGSAGTMQAYCAELAVPENWDEPSARQIRLRVALLTSSNAHARPDLVTFLDGGPGGAATEDFPAIAGAFAQVREHHDILLLDQRGTGGSNALTCPDDPDQNRDLGDNDAAMRRCLQAISEHAAPQFYTTTATTQDLEALRQALGSPVLDLVGVSYGTRVAQQYAGRFPGAVRSVVLDSVVPNRLALGSEHARNLEQALRALFAVCSADSTCGERFGDSYARLYRLRDRLQAHPQQVSLNDPNTYEATQVTLSAEDLTSIVRFYAYNPLTAALLPLMLFEAERGNFAPLLSQKRLLTDTLGAELGSALALSVVCAEDADLLTVTGDDASTLMGNSEVARLREACRIWPRGERSAGFHQPWRSDTPVLLLAGQYDPVTPPAYATQVQQTLSHSRMLLAPGQGHSVMTAGCLPRIMAQFIDALQPSKLDVQCLSELGSTPAFVDFNGAPP